MAFSKIELDFSNFFEVGNPIGETVNFKVNGVDKNEVGVLVRTSPGQFTVSYNLVAAANYMAAWNADYNFGQFTVSQAGTKVTIEAKVGGVEFTDFVNNNGGVSAVITNVPFDPVFALDSATLGAGDPPCTHIQIDLTVDVAGTPPYEWVSPLPGNPGLYGTVPRSGSVIAVTVKDADEDEDTINVAIPPVLDNTAINQIQVTGDPSGLFGTVAVFMNALTGLVLEYSLDGVAFQSSNVFTSVLPGDYTVYIRDQYGCTISQPFTVTLQTVRPPAYREIPRSNSFGWYERQSEVSVCSNPYKGTNAKPNNYKPLRWYNPPYYQPWCKVDSPVSQFRSNYDTITAKLFNLADDDSVATPVKEMTITQHSNNIGQRQIMDAKIFDRGGGQTGVYWLSGNIYDTNGTTVLDTFDLQGQLPEWAKVGQKFMLSGSAVDGLFEIKQIIFDSTLLVNAAVIDRAYTDVNSPENVKVDAVYNRLNYETYEFTTEFNDVPYGCYKIVLAMTDSQEEYPDSIWESLPISISSFVDDLVLIESSDHVDDGILYSTGIVHMQRFPGVFFEEEYPGTFETLVDSRGAVKKLDGRARKVFILEAVDVPYWVYEKLSLYISKNSIQINKLDVQFAEGFEVERNRTYSRVDLKAEAFVSNYEQYMTNSYDIL